MNEGELSGRLGLTGWPAVAEEAIIARDCAARRPRRLAAARLPRVHRRLGRADPLGQGKGLASPPRSPRTTCCSPTTWRRRYDPVYKVNPPLRTATDVAALRAGSPTAPSTRSRPTTRRMPWRTRKPSGPPRPSACSACRPRCRSSPWRWSRPGLLDWAGVAERMSSAPARIGRLAGQGRTLAVGAPANLVLIDADGQWTVEPTALASRSRNTPYAGRQLPAPVVATFLRGRPTVLDGKLQ